jgi:copper oxidase (laccase) domain-containing protein
MSEERPYKDLTAYQIGSAISTCQYEMSQAYGYERVVSELQKWAGEAFANGKDVEAKIYRTLSETYRKKGQELRETRHRIALDKQTNKTF